MANAQQLLNEKRERGFTNDVLSIEPQATVEEAARSMNEHHIGSLVVTSGGQLVGIFTERDVLQRVVAARRSPDTTSVSDVMTQNVACAHPETTLDEMRLEMREKRIRHLPVLQDDRVIGLISIGDLNRAENKGQERTIRYLQQYMSIS